MILPHGRDDHALPWHCMPCRHPAGMCHACGRNVENQGDIHNFPHMKSLLEKHMKMREIADHMVDSWL